MLALVTLWLAAMFAPAGTATEPPPAGDQLLLRYALLVGGRAGSPTPAVAGAMGSAELQELLLQWDPDADNDEVLRVFALNHLSEVARQASQLPLTGGVSQGFFTYGPARFDVKLTVAPGADRATIATEIRHDGELISAPTVATRFGDRAIVSGTDGPEAPLLFLVVDVTRVSAEDLRRKGMRFAWKKDLEIVDGERIKGPRALTRVNPAYPADAKEAGAEGQVVLRAVIGADGSVEAVEVVQGLAHGLSQAAVDAVRQWRFAPATLEGKPVRVVFMLVINFALPERADAGSAS